MSDTIDEGEEAFPDDEREGPEEEEEEPDEVLDPNFAHHAPLAKYAKCMAKFEYDRAKYTVDHYRDLCGNLSKSSSKWSNLYSMLSRLVGAERSYMAVAFLLPKSFLRKDNTLVIQFETLWSDLSKLSTTLAKNPKQDESVLIEIVKQVLSFVETRRKLMEFYIKAVNMGASSVVMDFDALVLDLDHILVIYKNVIEHRALSSLKALLDRETGIMRGFIGSLAEINHWKYLEALQKLFTANNELKQWETLVKSTKDMRKISFMATTLFSSQQDPLLYQWLFELKGAVASKFSLYFDEYLAQQAPEAVHKANKAKLTIDNVARLSSFQEGTDAILVTIVFDASNEPDYRGPGIHLQKNEEPLTGAQLYPAVATFPFGSEVKDLWPSIIMSINKFQEDLDTFDKVVYFFDVRTNLSYYIHRLDPKMTIVGLFGTDGPDADDHISSFFRDLGSQLRMTKIFASLKPGTK